MDIFRGSLPYSQGGNGLGGMFRGLVRTATPFRRNSKITKVPGKEFLTGTFNDLTQQKGDGRSRGYKRKRKAIPASSTQNKRLRTSPAKFKTIFD